MNVKEGLQEFQKLNEEIKRVVDLAGFECENIQYDPDNLDERFLRSQLVQLYDQLVDIQRRISYLSKPVVDQGFISHNSDGRYALPSGEYFTSGSVCEILYNEEKFNDQYWLYTTIEHNGEDYYATVLGRDVSINGMMVRIRR